MKNFHIFQISLVPMTDKFPPRIRIKSQRFKQSIIIPFQNEPGGDTHIVANAAIYLERMGFTLIGKGEGNDDYDYIVTDTFKPLKP
jgi:hypothetical protein